MNRVYLSWEDPWWKLLEKVSVEARSAENERFRRKSVEGMPVVWIGVVAFLQRRSLRPLRPTAEIDFPET